jgi:beta-lactamase class A
MLPTPTNPQDHARRPPRTATAAALFLLTVIVVLVAAAGPKGGSLRAAEPPTRRAPLTASPAASPSAAFIETLAAPAPAPGPHTVAMTRSTISRGDIVRLRYRVESASAETAAVTIVVERADGATVATLRPAGRQPCDRTLALHYRCRLPAGRYRYTVYAVDDLGREQIAAGKSALVVRDVVPTTADFKSAVSWLQRRSGVIGFAVVDSQGELHGWHADQQFVTASVVKAMMLVAYLRSHPSGPGALSSTLTNMIEVSDNSAASSVHAVVGDAGLYSVARAAGMTHFAGAGYWSGAQITAADQARFFSRIFELVPGSQEAYARHLLSGIASYQSWGIPTVGRPRGWTVYFKGGWRGTDRGQLVHQVARLEKDGRTITVAVMTDGDPSMGYGIETIRGAAQRVLGAR